MTEPIHCDDGCTLPPEEALRLFSLAFKTDEELHPDFTPVDGKTGGPFQSLMISLAISQHASLEALLAEGDRLSRLTIDELEREALRGNALAVALFHRADQEQQNLILHGDGKPGQFLPLASKLLSTEQ